MTREFLSNGRSRGQVSLAGHPNLRGAGNWEMVRACMRSLRRRGLAAELPADRLIERAPMGRGR